MSRAVVSVVIGDERFSKGQDRLCKALIGYAPGTEWWSLNQSAMYYPSHAEKPFAFKAYALREAAEMGVDNLLWCDASIMPIRSLEPLWERIERDGYWFANNAWTNYQWTADSAYPDLFPDAIYDPTCQGIDRAREINREIPHVVATAFGISTAHPKGKRFIDEFYRLASETKAFCGPWTNGPAYYDNPRQAPCGPPDVLGHRHDQTCASVLAWRLGFRLTEQPEIYAVKGNETDATILVADGSVNV